MGLESGYSGGRKTSHKAMAKVHMTAEKRMVGVTEKIESILETFTCSVVSKVW